MGNAGGGGGLAGAFAWVASTAGSLAEVLKVELSGAMTTLQSGALDPLKKAIFGEEGLIGAISSLMTTLGFDMAPGDGNTLSNAILITVSALTLMVDATTTLIGLLDRIISKSSEIKTKLSGIATDIGNALEAASRFALGDTTYDALSAPYFGRRPGNQAGAWRLPDTGMRFLHEGEMILPEGVASSIRSALTSPVSAMPVSSTVNNNKNVQFGDVSLGGGIDLAMLKYAVVSALRDEL